MKWTKNNPPVRFEDWREAKHREAQGEYKSILSREERSWYYGPNQCDRVPNYDDETNVSDK